MLKAPATIWELMSAGFQQARLAVPGEIRVCRFLLADMPVEITLVGQAICKLFTSSLSHLMVADFGNREPVLRIELWDSSMSGVPQPSIKISDALESAVAFEESILARSTDGKYFGYQTPGACTLLDFKSGRIVGCVASPAALSGAEIGRPLYLMLFAWYNSHAILPVHAGLVARQGQGVLIAGASGSGKSTTSLLCVQAGFTYLADDCVGLSRATGNAQTAYSMYSSLCLEREHSAKFEKLQTNRLQDQPTAELKQPFSIAEAFPERMASSCTVRAVVLPRVTHNIASKLRRASVTEAALRLAPSSVLQLPFVEPVNALQHITGMLRHVPSFWLDLGTDFDNIPSLVDKALDEATAQVSTL